MLSAAWDWYYGTSCTELLDNSQLDEPLTSTGPDISIQLGTLVDGTEITLFTMMKTEPSQITAIDVCAKRLKILRHPNILRYIGVESTDHASYLITERVLPLQLKITTSDANEIVSGLHDIARAVEFLHKQGKISHNCLEVSNIFVTAKGEWKISGMQFSCPFQEVKMEILKEITRPDEIIPPEEKANELGDQLKYGYCRDVYAFGMLLKKFKKQIMFASQVGKQAVESLIDEILQDDYTERPTMQSIFETEILFSEYISIVNFLQSITLKSQKSKDIFFNSLTKRLKNSCISSDLIARRLVPLLLSPVVLAEKSATPVVAEILSPLPIARSPYETGLIESDLFARYVIPIITDLLAVRILHVRQAIMININKFIHLFEKTVLTDVVLPEILLGLRDENNNLVKCSLHALADAVPIVGGDVIVGEGREKIFSFGLPKVNGSILVDASALACQVKPKRLPKQPKNKSKDNAKQKPKTLLEMALANRKQDTPSKEELLQKQSVFAEELKSQMYITNNNDDDSDDMGYGLPIINATDKDKIIHMAQNENILVSSNVTTDLQIEKTNELNDEVLHDKSRMFSSGHDSNMQRDPQLPQYHRVSKEQDEDLKYRDGLDAAIDYGKGDGVEDVPEKLNSIQTGIAEISQDSKTTSDYPESVENDLKSVSIEIMQSPKVPDNVQEVPGQEENEEVASNGWDVDNDWEDFDLDTTRGDEDDMTLNDVSMDIPVTQNIAKPIPNVNNTTTNFDLELGSEFEVKVQVQRHKSVDFFEDMLADAK